MKKRILTTFVFCLVSFAAKAETLVFASVDYIPYASAHMPEDGLLAAITREALHRSGHQLKIAYVPWRRALEGTKVGSYTGILGAFKTAEREGDYHYTEAIGRLEMVFVHKQDTAFPKTDNNLVGALRGTSLQDSLTEKGYQVDPFNDYPRGLKMAFFGRVDAILIDRLMLRHLVISDPDIAGFANDLTIAEPAHSCNILHLPISRAIKDGAALVEQINRHHKAMLEDGTIARILDRFQFPDDLEPASLNRCPG
ncbi:ABC-type amino acid transport substrate-binding protein [Aestuariispira insulae]|uniref:ABC-type amino acid transport substrate-binding protein n=2 Tax=Aestuariispira insulae TaxID=1461337 RepID=A0A3D9HT69_9PROT|nr:ABC-type amino acid transport substrate-binding protein [Aestuariispira insulae]